MSVAKNDTLSFSSLRELLRPEPDEPPAGPFDLVHAHYALPAGDAVRRAAPEIPLVVSAHGGDVLGVARASQRGRRTVARALAHARLVLANSAGTAERCAELGARDVRVVHLGTDLPAPRADRGRPHPPKLVTVGHLVARKRHADVVRAAALLRERHPGLRYVVVGDGPERGAIGALAGELGMSERVEAFGVAYVEAMAGGVPAIGSRGEAGPEEIAAAGGGIRLVGPGDVEALAAEVDRLLTDPEWARELGAAARATVEAAFTWEGCGRDTVAAYEAALA